MAVKRFTATIMGRISTARTSITTMNIITATRNPFLNP